MKIIIYMVLALAFVQTSWGAPPVQPGIYRVSAACKFRVVRQELLVITHTLPAITSAQRPFDYDVVVEPRSALRRSKLDTLADGNVMLTLEVSATDPLEEISVRIDSRVFVGTASVARLGKPIPLPEVWPEEVRAWLKPTREVDFENEGFAPIIESIKKRSHNLSDVVTNCVAECGSIRKSNNQRAAPPTRTCMASATLRSNGFCTSAANQLAALLRGCGVPARIIAGYPTWAHRPFSMHFIVEYYAPQSGWSPIESTWLDAEWPSYGHIYGTIVSPAFEESSKRRGYVSDGVPQNSGFEFSDFSLISNYTGTLDPNGSDHLCELEIPLAIGSNELAGELAHAWEKRLAAGDSTPLKPLDFRSIVLKALEPAP